MSEAHAHTLDKTGLTAGLTAYTLWGIFPIYFKLTDSVPALELLSHRIVWAVPIGALIIVLRRQIKDVITAIRTPKVLMLLVIAAIALSANWGVYIYAVQIDQIFQGSLGYYINPLMYVLVGVFFLGERLSRTQGLAVGLASVGVLILTLYGGVFPYISLFLAVSFTTYGVVRKQVAIGAMPGLFIETLLLFLIAAGYLLWLNSHGQLSFASADMTLKSLILLAGPITVFPLLAFAIAARRLKLSTIGFLQFIAPTMQFLCGVYYGEPFTLAHALCFGFIWTAIAIFSWDAYRRQKRTLVRPSGPA